MNNSDTAITVYTIELDADFEWPTPIPMITVTDAALAEKLALAYNAKSKCMRRKEHYSIRMIQVASERRALDVLNGLTNVSN